MCVAERGRGMTHVLLRGNPNLAGDEVEPGVPEVLTDGSPTFGSGPAAAGAGRVVDRPRNPRTARVMVNRLWQHHFGRGLVPTPNDFGKLGEAASHPELLDWLAAEFMDGDWRIKRMHRLIMLSTAYRMSSGGSAAGLAIDRPTRLWRFPMRRLTAEEVRDSILAVAARSISRRAGPASIRRSRAKSWPASRCRGRAGRHRHQARPPGAASMSMSNGRYWFRSWPPTTRRIPIRVARCAIRRPCRPRHWDCLNGEFANEQAVRFAGRLRRECPDDLEGQVDRAISLTTAQHPSPRNRGRRGVSRKAEEGVARGPSDGPDSILPDGPECQRLPLPGLMGSHPWT